MLKESREYAFIKKKKKEEEEEEEEKKEKGMKNAKKSYAWSGFSKIGLQLVR